jgi:hypothetical protein
VRIARLERRRSPYSSSFPVDELDLCLHDGIPLKLVMKDLSASAMSAEARRVRPDFLYDPRREIQVYRWILPHAPSGTAAWYGAVVNATARRYWLFLERVAGLELRHVGALGAWTRAARWIARFHRSFAASAVSRLVHTSRLLVYDDAFYWMWLERAQRFAARRPRVREIVDRIARRHSTIVDRLVRLPRTLIHGEFYPCNIMIQRGRGGRVCPVDWEMAAFAPGLMDLASLTTGWSPRVQRALAAAYCDESERETAASIATDLDCCRLHLAVRMLGWSDAWEPPPQHAHDWLSDAARIAERLHC